MMADATLTVFLAVAILALVTTIGAVVGAIVVTSAERKDLPTSARVAIAASFTFWWVTVVVMLVIAVRRAVKGKADQLIFAAFIRAVQADPDRRRQLMSVLQDGR